MVGQSVAGWFAVSQEEVGLRAGGMLGTGLAMEPRWLVGDGERELGLVGAALWKLPALDGFLDALS